MTDPQTFSNVACTVCGCVCDDLELDLTGDRLTPRHGACSLAEPWFRDLSDCRPYATTVTGAPATFAEAVSRAAAILRESRNPLIYGLSRSSTPGQRAAVSLAERLCANIDTTASV